MNQQQNKHSSKNKKRERKPAKLISSEFAIIDIDGVLRANFKTIDEVNNFLEATNQKMNVYNIKIYKLNEKTIKTNQKIGD